MNAFFWDVTSGWKTEEESSNETAAVGYLSPKYTLSYRTVTITRTSDPIKY